MPQSKRADAEVALRLLHAQGHTHLKVSARGPNLTVSSEEDGDDEPRLRLSVLPGGRYGVSFPSHTGKWEQAPISGTLQEVLDEIQSHFGWHLDPWPGSATNF
jgi:hypothetical protein